MSLPMFKIPGTLAQYVKPVVVKYVRPVEVGYLAQDFNIKDTRDCAVRALANVSALTYPECRDMMADEGRASGRGTAWNTLHRVYVKAGAKRVCYYGKMATEKNKLTFNVNISAKGVSLKTLTTILPKGRHIVLVKGHALALCDGKIIDTFSSKAGVHVKAVYTF